MMPSRNSDRSHGCDQPAPMVTTPKIVHCNDDFKAAWRGSGSRVKPFKDHLIGVTRGPLTLFRRAHGPSEQGQPKKVTGNPGGCRRQFVDPIGDEIGPRSKSVAQLRHAAALFG